MKKFIATITYGTEYVHGSRFVQVEASSQKIAEKRAMKFAKQAYVEQYNLASKYLDIVVEELTPKKAAAIKAQYEALRALVESLADCSFAVEGIAKI